jgi:hypothetical protein
MVADVGARVTGTAVREKVVPPIVGVRVPGRDVVVEMGGEPWRLLSARRQPPLLLLVRIAKD